MVAVGLLEPSKLIAFLGILARIKQITKMFTIWKEFCKRICQGSTAIQGGGRGLSASLAHLCPCRVSWCVNESMMVVKAASVRGMDGRERALFPQITAVLHFLLKTALLRVAGPLFSANTGPEFIS